MQQTTCSTQLATCNRRRASARGACVRARVRIDNRTSQEVVASAVAVVDQVLSSDATRAKLLAEEADLMAQIAAAEAEELWSAAEWEVRQNTNSE